MQSFCDTSQLTPHFELVVAQHIKDIIYVNLCDLTFEWTFSRGKMYGPFASGRTIKLSTILFRTS